jgi:hypothetical protein
MVERRQIKHPGMLSLPGYAVAAPVFYPSFAPFRI